MRKLWIFLLLIPTMMLAAGKNTHPLGTINVNEQMAPFKAYYDTRTEWPRAHGWKPYMREQWDLIQRGWPNGDVPTGGIWEAYQQLGRMRRHSLDEAWENLGPFNHGGRCRTIRFHPNTTQIMFAGSVSGGLFKSTDSGENWLPITDNLPNLAVGCFEIDPMHPDTMYIGTGEGYWNGDAVLGIGLLKTTDGGFSWNTTGLSYPYNQGKSILKMSIDPRDTQILLVSNNDNLKRSVNGGQTFTNVLTAEVKSIIRDPENPDILLCAAGSPWGSANNGIFKSTNNGVNWTRVSDGLPATNIIGRIVLTYYPQNPQIVYAGICGTFDYNGSQTLGIYRSLDGGESWQRMSQAGENHYASQGWYDMAIAVKPGSSNTILSSGLDLHRSTNSGLHWSTVSHWDYDINSPYYVHADHHEIVFDPTNSNTVWAVTDGGIFKSSDGGSNWTEKNHGFVTFQYYAMGNATLDTVLAYGGTQDNGTSRWSNSPNWDLVFGGDGGYCVVDYTNNNTVYVEWQNGHRSRSDNGGSNWSDINPGIDGDGAWVCPMVLDAFDHQTIYTTTSSNHKVWKSPNQGRNSSWVQLGQDLTGDLQTIAPSPVVQGRLYAGSNNTVYRLDPNSDTWLNVTGNLPGQWITHVIPDPFSADGIYVTLSGFGGSHVYKSTQAGSVWVDITGNLPDVPTQDLVVDLNDASTLYVGNDLGVFFTSNGGQNWEIYGEGLPAVRVDDMEMQTATGKLRVATHGRGMWQVATGSLRVSMLYPNGGEMLVPGNCIDFRWAGSPLGGNVKIEINRAYPSANWETLFPSTSNDGTESWVITGLESQHVRFRISHLTVPGQTDTTNTDSWIVNPRLDLVWPNGGETVLSGVRDTVRFDRTLVTEAVRIELNRDYPGGTWEEITNNITADTYLWSVRLPAAQHCRVRIISQDRPDLGDTSYADFTLRAPVMTLSSPNGGEMVALGDPYEIHWSATEHQDRIRITFNRNYPSGTWETITSNSLNDGEYEWVPTGSPSSLCRVRVSSLWDPQTYVESASNFTIEHLATDPSSHLPTTYTLTEPYPNPFNPTTQISMELPSRTHVEAYVFNRLGQHVLTLVNGEMDAGKHKLTFDGSNLPSGLYFIRVKAMGEAALLKAVLLK